MGAADKINRIIDLQNEIHELITQLDQEDKVKILTVTIEDTGRKDIHIYKPEQFVSLFNQHDCKNFRSTHYEYCIEIDDVKVFALENKLVEESA